ncbi:MAG: hypothetical protein H0T46_34095 [Deltaproteobacteria bacterium]|nr:hypothetical protein [Deltaproteobacteria bacterium]
MKAALLLVLAAAGCEVTYEPDVGKLQPPDAEPGPAPDDGGEVAATGKCVDSAPMVSVSFSRDLRPLLSKSPGGCGCHSSNAASGFNLGSYENLRRGGASSGTRIVVPGKPCESILLQKLGLAPPFGARMPYNGPPYFSAAELTLVRDWIAEGALDN